MVYYLVIIISNTYKNRRAGQWDRRAGGPPGRDIGTWLFLNMNIYIYIYI